MGIDRFTVVKLDKRGVESVMNWFGWTKCGKVIAEGGKGRLPRLESMGKGKRERDGGGSSRG